MDTIKYDFASIGNAAADIKTSAGRINSTLADIKRMIEPMVSTWEGEAAIAYQAAQKKWDDSANELNIVLDTISRTVDDGNQRMSDTNRQAANSW